MRTEAPPIARDTPAAAVATTAFAFLLGTMMVLRGSQLALAAVCMFAALVSAGRAWWPQARGAWRPMAVFLIPAFVYLAIIAVQIASGVAETRLSESVSIALLSLLSAMTTMPLRVPVRSLLRAAAVGAIGALALALYQFFFEHIDRVYGLLGASDGGTGAIKFGDLAGMLALFSLLVFVRPRNNTDFVLGLAGFVSGILAVGLTRSRGPLIGIALALLCLAIVSFARRQPGAARPRAGRWKLQRRTMVAAALTAIALLGAIALSAQRFAAIATQVERYDHGDANSEAGHRLALWNAALRAARHAPLTGVGFDRFEAEMARQHRDGEMPAGQQIPYSHAHNEFLCALATGGIPAFLALSVMFIGPLFLLMRITMRTGPPADAVSASIVFTALFGGFALTDCMFDRQLTLLVFFFVGGWLFRAAMGEIRQAEEAGTETLATAGRRERARAGFGSVNEDISVAIITKNEEAHILDCLDSVAFAGEWIVVDSGSSDRTVRLAREWGATVIQTPDWPGFGPQKNRALDACTKPWVLSIDADERIGPELADHILAATRRTGDEARSAHAFRRLSRFCAQPMHFGLWSNDWVLRLAPRADARFSDDPVHERLLTRLPVRRLCGTMGHDSVSSCADAREKAHQYAALGAPRLRARGKGGLASALLHGGWTLLRAYLLKLGFLDGVQGWRLAWYSALGSFLRYRMAGREMGALPSGPARGGEA